MDCLTALEFDNECTMCILNMSCPEGTEYTAACINIVYLDHASLVLLCVILLALYPYVSMRIVTKLVNYQQLNNA